jgi:hypothetical protein
MVRTDTTTIEIDLEIYKLIQAERQSFDETNSEILRRLLKLGPREVSDSEEGGLNIGHGVFLPNGTLLKRKYKGVVYEAPVKEGKIWAKGKSFTSPSGAAVEVTGSAVNGWQFWAVKRPGEETLPTLSALKGIIVRK